MNKTIPLSSLSQQKHLILTLPIIATAISAMILSSTTTSASTEVVDQTSITVPIACTMSGTGTTHTATISPGTYSGASDSEYENGIGKTALTAICNDDNGFSIYAIGYTNNEYGTTTLIGQNTNTTIPTKAYQSGDTTSNWSMKLTKVTNASESYNPQNLTLTTSYDTWHAVPSEYTKVAEYHANTGSSTTDAILGVKLETTYAVYISSSQPADTYVGQVKYTMVHPYTEAPLQPQTATSGCINYFPNGSNVEGTMGCQFISKSATSATLLASNFSRTGYGFAGWSNKFDYATNPNQEGIKFYGPQEDITFAAGEYTGSNNGLALYAVWVKSEGSIQDTAKVSEVCNRLTTAPTDGTANLSSVSAFTDSRDNNTYAVAKLADGKCWMIENLRLDNSATLTTVNTNKPLNDGTNATIKHNYTDTTTSNTLSPTSNVDYDASTAPDGWCTTNSAACDDQSRLRTDNTANRASNPTNNSGNMYSYGNYYNWYSATVGNGTYDFSTNNSVAGDLCPAGWRLPKGGNKTRIESNDDNEFWNLTVDALNGGTNPANYSGNTYPNYGTTEARPVGRKLRTYPNNYLYSGYVYGGSLISRDSNGFYWSSTAGSSYSACSLYLGSSSVYPGTNGLSKYVGSTVRCIAGSE